MKWDWKSFYDKAFDWLLLYGPRIILALVVFFIGLWLIRIFNRWLKKVFEKRRFNSSIRYFLLNLVAISLQVFLLLMAFQVAGIQLTFFAAIVAGFSVAAGLALSGTLQNFVSGILILALRPYSVGENVVMQGQEGTVTSIQLFYTIILSVDNKTIIVPNGLLSNNVVINLSRQGKRRLDINLKFPYTNDAGEIKKILEKAIGASGNCLNDPVARIGVSELEPDRYAVSVQVWVDAKHFEDSKFILLEKIMNDLKSEAIIASSK